LSRILAYTTPARGHLFPAVPLLDELRDRGHDIAVRTLGSEVPTMQARGFSARPIDPALEAIEHDDYLGRSPLDGLKRGVAVFSRRAPVDAADLQRAITDERPEMLLVDVNAWGAGAVAEASGLPWAVWCPYPLPLPSRDTPPFGPGLRPARGPLGRLRDAVLRPVMFGALERIIVPRVNEVRARLGLPAVDGAGGMYDGVSTLLYLTAEPFEYPRSDWPANVRMVGPCDWDPPADPPEWLTAIERPIVLVTTSSEFQDDGRLAEVALEALAHEDVHVVVTVPAGDVASFDPLPNAHVVSFVPHGLVLERAVCAVTHGGMGATQKALARGVPVCVVPFGRDQLEVARRVELAGAGTRLPKGRLRPDRLRAAVRQARTRTAGAQRIARAFADAGGARVAADHAESILAHQPAG
jgi:UDP:flavonoid glycosyltransferase YjiC (YdhE family)